jgi:hypothetical protein
MMIQGLGFLGLSVSLLLPSALTGVVEGQRITESLVRDVFESSTVQKTPPPTNPQLISANTTPTTYYVSGTGSDKNSGLSASSPFLTIQRAADLTNPGDTVLIMNGVYTNASGSASVVSINRSGNASAWITYAAYPGHSPKIQHNTWNGILVSSGVSYIQVSGLEVVGNNQNITYAYALSQQQNALNPLTNGNCINMDGRNAPVHHINILNNKVHDCGGGGIIGIGTDYVQLNNNTVFNNAWYGVNASSGISFLQNSNTDTHQGYKMYILNNTVYNNQMYVPWIVSGTFTDGNGIIIDSSIQGLNGAYQGRTLIANNVSYQNGGTGIHTYESEHVDILFNTTYLNNQTSTINNGQIMSNFSNDINVLDNILYAAPNRPINFNNQSTNVTFNYNLYNNNGYPVNAVGPNDIMADPQFTNASIGNFTLQQSSPAINSAYPTSFVPTNILGGTRSSTPNRGAY